MNRTSLSMLSNADTLLAKGGTIGIPDFFSTYSGASTRENTMSPQNSLVLDRDMMRSTDDMGTRAAHYRSFEKSIATSERRYKAAFHSKLAKHHPLRASAPGFLDFENTPRLPPSINNCITRPATSILGAENELSYHSVFRSKTIFPRPIESKINGGSILTRFDSKMDSDSHGKFLVTEGSIAQNSASTLRTYASTFGTKKLDNTIVKETHLDYRHKDGGTLNWHGNLAQEVEASGMRYSKMTTKSDSSERFPLGKAETRYIKEFYDIGRCTPCPDLAVKVERSPILYSVFNSPTHSGDWINPKHVHDVQMLAQDDMMSTPRGVRWMPGDRFPPPGHPDDMFPLPVCRNEKQETTRHTIAERLTSTPIKYASMQSTTKRTTPIDLSRGVPGRPTAPMAATNESHDHELVTKGLPIAQLPMSASVERMARNYQSAFSSLVDRFATNYSLNPSETLEHHKRRQHLLESRITSIRDEMHKKSGGEMSPKLKKILNL